MRTVLVFPDEGAHRDLVDALGEFPEIEVVRKVPHYPEVEEFLRILRARRPDFVFISGEDLPRFQTLAAAVDDRMPGLPVVCVSRDGNPLDLIPKLMHLGVRELLASPVTHEKLGKSIAAIAGQLVKHPPPLVRMGDLYAFLPAKPGVGASTIAVSASCALADELHVRTLLLDCDLMAGVIRFLLKLGNSSSIINALDHADSLDEDMWRQMVGHWDGLEVLHAGELTPPSSLSAAGLEVLLGFARAQYDTICADLASSMDPFTVQIMQEASRIFLVTTPELVPLYLAADRLRSLKEIGLADKVSLLLNRKSRGLSDGEAAHLVGIPVAYQFSNDYCGVQTAVLEGLPVSHRSNLGQSIVALARSLAPDQAARIAPTRQRRFLEFFHVPATRDGETAWRD
jgi:pilus assembly protein CpaE